MKHLLLVILTMWSVVGLAGDPSQDPNVKNLQDKVKNGLNPKPAELVLGSNYSWECNTFSARKDTYETASTLMVFADAENTLSSTGHWKTNTNYTDLNILYFQQAERTEGRLTLRNRNFYEEKMTSPQVYYVFPKLTDNKNLVLEWATSQNQGVPSIVDSKLFAEFYSVCTVR